MVCVAFVVCFKIGVWKHQYRKAIKVKKHGYKAKSFFRYGLDHCRKALRKMESKGELMEEILLVLIQDLEHNLESFKARLKIILEKKCFVM